MLTSLYIWYYLFVPVILVDDLTFYLTWSIQLDCFLYSPAWYTWLCFEITRRNWKLITFQNKQNYFYVLTSVHRKQECLSWRENFSLKWKFDLFLFFFVLFFCFVCCVVLWFFFLHSGQTSPYQNYPYHWASETISYAYSSKPDEKSAWSKKQKKRKQIKFMYFFI